jgi:uncharacterized delta-60 repeat protein
MAMLSVAIMGALLAGLLAAMAVLTTAVVVPASALAAPGDLDISFGNGGIVSSSTGVTENFGLPADVAVQTDGKIVAVSKHETCAPTCQSEFLVERFNSDGSLDSSFGGGGLVLTSFAGSSEAAASSVIVEPSGKILVGGAAGGELALARYNSDGGLDSSFGGGDGKVTAAVSASNASGFRSESGSMALLPNGQVVLGGNVSLNQHNPQTGESFWEPHMVVARFTADGSLDTSFGTGGIAIGPEGDLYGLAVDGSGRILAAGWSSHEFAVARFTSSGSLDTSFAGTGLVKMNLNVTGSKAADVLVQPGGKILASGYGIGMTLFRFNENGSLDSSFGGGDGTVTPSFGSPCCIGGSAVGLALEADGRIVIAGGLITENYEEENPFTYEWTAARLHANGVPDKTFGTDGLTTEGFEGTKNYGEYATGISLQSDGKVVAVGTSGYPNSDLGVMRFLGGGSDAEPSYHRLDITNADPSDGRVRAPDLFCGYNCAADYEAGETVELSAEGEYVQEGSEWVQQPFIGWTTISGDPGTCTGATTPCKLTLSRDVEVAAHFGSPTGGEEPGGEAGGGSGGSSENPSGGGGDQTGANPSTAPSPSPVPATPKPKALQCRKGFKKAKVHGKARCVKVKSKRHQRGL